MDFYIKDTSRNLYVRDKSGDSKRISNVWKIKKELDSPLLWDAEPLPNSPMVDAEITFDKDLGWISDQDGLTAGMSHSGVMLRTFPVTGNVWGIETATEGGQGLLIAGPFSFSQSTTLGTYGTSPTGVAYRFRHRFKAPSDLWDNPTNYRFGCAIRAYMSNRSGGIGLTIVNLQTGQSVGLGTGISTDTTAFGFVSWSVRGSYHCGFNLRSSSSPWVASQASPSNSPLGVLRDYRENTQLDRNNAVSP